jgi:flagellin
MHLRSKRHQEEEMSLNLISNFAANVAHRNLTKSDGEMTDSLAKLSSGTRVVSAKDDAASMAIGSRLNAEVKALAQAQVNSGQAISMLQVADGAMARAHDILMRMKTLSVQAGSGQLSSTERSMLDTEYQQLLQEIDRLALDTEFNGNQLVNGSIAVNNSSATDFQANDGIQNITFRGAFAAGTGSPATLSYGTAAQSFTMTTGEGTFTGALPSNIHDGTNMSSGTVVTLSDAAGILTEKVDLIINTAFAVNATHATGTLTLTGATTASYTYKVGTGTSPTADEITVSLGSISADALGLDTTNVTTKIDADAASLAISNAIDALNTARANVGAAQNRIEFAKANIATTLENTEAARSDLLDLDVAHEMSMFTSKQILVQAGVAMLAQANQTPQNLLRLFQ